MSDRLKVPVYHDFDWREIEGVPLKQAIDYLTNLAKQVPEDAYLDEHWEGYEDMEMRLVSHRLENDAEYEMRKKVEAAVAKLEREKGEKVIERERRRTEYLRLKREFG